MIVPLCREESMSLAQAVNRANTAIEQSQRSHQFVQLCKYLMLGSRSSGGGPGLARMQAAQLATADGVRGAVVDVLKSAVTAGGLDAGTTWGSALADLKLIASAFASSLSNAGVFDKLLGFCIPIPMGEATATLGAVSLGIQGYVVGEASAKQVSRLSLSSATATPRKAHAVVSCTNELLKMGGAAANTLLTRELVQAAVAAVDKEFMNCLLSGVTVGTSAGSTAESVRSDIAGLLTQVPIGRSSRVFLITTARIAAMWSTMGSTSTNGQGAFPEMTPAGGVVCGIPVLVADEDSSPSGSLPAGYVLLADCSGIAAGATPPEPSTISEGSIISDTAPDSPVVASTVVESLWQQDKSALMIERWFICSKLRTAAVAAISNANSYASGFSPP
jgi:hypothetical protein